MGREGKRARYIKMLTGAYVRPEGGFLPDSEERVVEVWGDEGGVDAIRKGVTEIIKIIEEFRGFDSVVREFDPFREVCSAAKPPPDYQAAQLEHLRGNSGNPVTGTFPPAQQFLQRRLTGRSG